MAASTASDIMTADPITVTPEMPVTDAAHLMVEKDVGGLPVLDEDGRLIGLVTESDLIIQDAKVHFPTYLSLLGGYVFYPGSTEHFEESLRKAVGATVGDVMSEELHAVSPGTAVSDVATLMVDRDIGRVPVVEGDRVVGIISKSDIVRAIGSEQ